MLVNMKKAIEALGAKVYGDLVMIDGILYPLPLVQGNEKLGKTVWHSSTVPTCETLTATDADGNEISEKGTCPMTCKGCYATTGHYRYNKTKYFLIMRTRLLREHADMYFYLVAIQIKYQKIERLRIHAAGDFISGEAAGFAAVLRQFPDVKAWTYTKCQISGEIAELDALPNCNVVKSVIPACGFNFGHIDYIISTFHKLQDAGKSVYVCRCGIDKNQHCSDCDGCCNHEYVLFVEHSTGYDAAADAMYSDLVKLIESQN